MGDWNFDSLVYAGSDFPRDGIGNHLGLIDRLIFNDPDLELKSLDETIVHRHESHSYGRVPPYRHLATPDAFRHCLYLDVARDMVNPAMIEHQKQRAREFKSRYNAVTGVYLFWESDRIANEILGLLKTYDFCIVTASFVARELEAFEINTVLLPHPYEFPRVDPVTIAVPSRPSPLRFGSSAGLWRRKNLSLLVEVFAQEFGSDPAYSLSVHTRSNIADRDHAPEFGKIRPYLERHSNITILPKSLSQTDYQAWMKSLDVYCCISSGEGFSVSPREALHLGKPVVLSDAHVHHDLRNLPGVLPVKADEMQPAQPNSEACQLEIGFDWAVDRRSLAEALHAASDRFEELTIDLGARYADISDMHDLERIKREWIRVLNEQYARYRIDERVRPFASEVFLSDWLEHHAPRVFRVGTPDLKSNTGEIVGERLYCFVSKHGAGHCIYGPDFRVLIGRWYEVEFHIRFLHVSRGDDALVSLDVYDHLSRQIIAFREIRDTAPPRTTQRLAVDFAGQRDQVLEFRVYWHQTCDIEISKIVLRPLAVESKLESVPTIQT